MKKIVIIGAGQLGSRHLQALASLTMPHHIYIVDPSAASLQTAENRWAEVNGDGSKLTAYTEIGSLPEEIDLVIIATASSVRRKIVEQLLAHASVNYMVLEKFLFQAEEDFHAVLELINHHGVETWVNTPRRMFDGYTKIKEGLDGPLVMSVLGSNWGLACNSIHWVDLFCYLSGELPQMIDARLEDELVASKRDGYVEFNGSLIVAGDKGSMLFIHCFGEGNHPIDVSIDTPASRFSILESKELSVFSSAQDNWQRTEEKFSIPRQSQLTNVLAEQILTSGNCSLPPYKDSMDMHLPLLAVFQDHYNSITGTQEKLCPIT